MLGGFRKFVRSKLGFALFVLLIISFGIFGFQDPFRGIMGGGFLQVGERTIRSADIDRGLQEVIENIRQEEGRIVPPRDPENRRIAEQVYAQERNQALILEYARKIGVVASPTAVSNLLMNRAPRFKDALGRFNMEEVKRAAEEQRQSVEQFQNEIRDSLTFGYMLGAVQAAPVTPDIITRPLLTFFGEQRPISAARVNPAGVPQPKEPTEEELKAWYEQNKQRFAQPERRRISLLTYSEADFWDKVPVTDEQIKAEYDRRIKDFSTPETREVAQFTGERAALQTLVDTVKQGVAPEEAIRRSPGVTRADLSLKPGNLTDEQYDKFVFGIQPGQIMGPVEVGETWYAVLVTNVVPGIPTPLDQVRDGIRRGLQTNEARRMFNNSEETFYDMAGGVALEELGANIGAPTILLPPVDSHGHNAKEQTSLLLAGREDALRALFTLSPGQMTDVIEGEEPDGEDGERPARAIMRLDEVIPAHTLTFEEARAEARRIYLATKVQEAAEKLANDMVAATKAGRSFEQAATANRMFVLGSIPLVRGLRSQIDPLILNAAFGLKLGEASMVRDSAGAPWVLKVDKIDQIDEAMATGFKAQIDSDVAQTLMRDIEEVFLRGVQKEVPVTESQAAVADYFDRLTRTEGQ
jgi:peptidyl-prolyl cis-trans isomerase D